MVFFFFFFVEPLFGRFTTFNFARFRTMFAESRYRPGGGGGARSSIAMAHLMIRKNRLRSSLWSVESYVYVRSTPVLGTWNTTACSNTTSASVGTRCTYVPVDTVDSGSRPKFTIGGTHLHVSVTRIIYYRTHVREWRRLAQQYSFVGVTSSVDQRVSVCVRAYVVCFDTGSSDLLYYYVFIHVIAAQSSRRGRRTYRSTVN
jgi:hypothetical protein